MPGTNGWQELYHIAGHEYIPRLGEYSEYIASSNRFVTKVSFWFDQVNVDKIINYNNGVYNLPGVCTFGGNDGYVTVDVVANPHPDKTEKLDAYYIVTNLPNPVKDLENDSLIGLGYREESEVVALGTVIQWKKYYVKTYWRDYRPSNGIDDGVVGVNFGISHQTFFGGDYNDCLPSPNPPAAIENSYSGQHGHL